MATKGGLHAIDAAIDGAKPAAKAGPRRGRSPVEEPELPLLPAGCPVQPLGKLGQTHYFLDERGQLIGLTPEKVNKNHIRSLFGRRSELCDQFWPRLSDKLDKAGNPIITGWKPEIAGDQLMRACAWEGIFDPQGKVRGRGAHRGADGELILHRGDKVYFAGTHNDGWQDPGLIGGFVYPTAPGLPRPDPEDVSSAPAERLLELLRTWNWARSLIDPMLLLGWVGAAMVGGALTWRPHAWVTGSSATGKSSLQHVLELVFDGGALHTHDATEAALRQLLMQQTLPVFFDELEAEEDNRRNKAVIKLARLASSGAVVLRGGQDHQGHEFVARSCFLFSSILLPPMLAQDRNRLAVLDLNRFPKGAKPPAIDDNEIRLIGRQFLKRLAQEWHRFGDTLARYGDALADVGHGGRSQDQFGTLLAIADLLLYDETDGEVVTTRAGWLDASTLAEKAMDLADEEEIVQFLGNSFLPVQKGGEEPVPIVRHIRDALTGDGDKARERLENFGLRIVAAEVDKDGKAGARKPKGTPAPELFLAIANQHEGLKRIFREERWSEGVWAQSFARVEGAHRRVKVRFAGGNGQWSTLIPIPAIVELELEQ